MRTLSNPLNQRVIVLDTSALVAGFDPFSISEQQFTVPNVICEIVENSSLGFRLRTAEENGKIRVKAPETEALEKVRGTASEVGDVYFLSETDIQVLALALELKTQGLQPLVATDDYSIQNVAKQLGVQFTSLATFGIRRRLHWLRYCPACHKNYRADYESSTCDVCGTKLKRKPIREKNPQDSDKKMG